MNEPNQPFRRLDFQVASVTCASIVLLATFLFAGNHFLEGDFADTFHRKLAFTVTLTWTYFLLCFLYFSRWIRSVFLDPIKYMMIATSQNKNAVEVLKSIEPQHIEMKQLKELMIEMRLMIDTETENEKKKSEELNRLSAQFAHDIMSPLTAIRISLGTFEKTHKEFADLGSRACERIELVAAEVLAKFKSTLRQDFTVFPVDLASLVANIVLEKKLEFQKFETLFLNFASSENTQIHALANKLIISRIISNVLNNAAEAMNFVGAIDIKVRKESGNAILLVADHGCGIPEALLQKVGQVGFTTKETGNGIGLAHAYEHIRRWGGTIEINSATGKGTVLSISIPLAPEPI